MTKFTTAKDYIASFPPDVARDLEALRAAILAGAPGAEEVLSYGVPAYKLSGWLYYISAHTRHYTLSSPPPNTVWDAFADEIAGYRRSKSALQFPRAQPLPLDLITRMTAAKAAGNAAAWTG
jgi:uncharacterized protein YdhG (YjbR/CyaY superfamily)